MPDISKAMIRAIKTTQRKLGMDDDTYRALLESKFAVRSCTQLDARQALRLFMYLNGGGKTKRRARRPTSTNAAPVVHNEKIVCMDTWRRMSLRRGDQARSPDR